MTDCHSPPSVIPAQAGTHPFPSPLEGEGQGEGESVSLSLRAFEEGAAIPSSTVGQASRLSIDPPLF